MVKGKRKGLKSGSNSSRIIVKETQFDRKIMKRSTSKRRALLEEMRRKKIERDILHGKQGTLDSIGGRAPSRKGIQCYSSIGM